MFKVTLIFILFFLLGCRSDKDATDLDQFELQLNKDAEKKLDAAYDSITKHCDSLMIHQVPLKADSILKTDTLK